MQNVQYIIIYCPAIIHLCIILLYIFSRLAQLKSLSVAQHNHFHYFHSREKKGAVRSKPRFSAAR